MLGKHRAKTYLCLLEHIRSIVMKRFQDKKEQCATWNSKIPLTVNAKIIKASRKSRLLKMLSTGNREYELGVSCSHALAEISHYLQHRDGIVEFVHPSLTKTAFQQTYASMIHPILTNMYGHISQPHHSFHHH
ncbi:hypothetical protein ACOSP7_004795 [Xanthoceras sorbifolium]